MADGEWGGVQFRVATADSNLPNQTGNTQLTFSYGGWQQARGATLRKADDGKTHGNRFYMEGSIEFLDAPGEWHLDSSTHVLSIIPPAEVVEVLLDNNENRADALNAGLHMDLVATQTDSLFAFLGADSATDRVEHIVLANMTFTSTSAQYFLPHEETSGGDYAIHRGGAIFAENASMLELVGNTVEHIGGNAVFLSNSVRNITVHENVFRFLGTSGVSLVGRTAGAMMDARDGEAMVGAGAGVGAATAYAFNSSGGVGDSGGAGVDNLVRLPRVRCAFSANSYIGGCDWFPRLLA
jgi:hypothetical protein